MKSRFLRLAALAAVALALPSCSRPRTSPDPQAATGSHQQVVLVSLDGFRWDYFNRPQARNIRALAARGVHAQRMVPSYPSVTFPNHYTIVTGLYPEHHGIISNTMFDSTLGWFHISDTAAVRNAAWWGGEPIWATAVQQGERSGAFFWPGSEAPEAGVRPTRYLAFDDRFPNAARVDTVLHWLTLPADSAMSIVTLYYSDVDHAGHAFGPDSPQVDSAIARVDSMIGLLSRGIAERGLSDRVNLIVLADHGMTAIKPNAAIALDDYAPLASYDIVSSGEIGLITPKPGKLDEVFAALHAANPHLHVYRRADVPARFHYNDNPRITPLVLIPDPGYIITTRAAADRRPPSGGAHGYDNLFPDMGALFVAAGPSFRQGVTVAPFQNIHVYDLLCHILGLEPAPNDGSLDSTRSLLR